MDKPKKKSISDRIDQGEQLGDAVKIFTDDKTDAKIDKVTRMARLANELRKGFGGLFGGKKKLF